MILNGEAYFLRSIEVAIVEQYFQVLKEVKKLLEENGAMVCAVVGDNAPRVQNAIGRCASGCVYAVFFPFSPSGLRPRMLCRHPLCSSKIAQRFGREAIGERGHGHNGTSVGEA